MSNKQQFLMWCIYCVLLFIDWLRTGLKIPLQVAPLLMVCYEKAF